MNPQINPAVRADFLADLVKNGEVADHRLVVVDERNRHSEWPWRFAATMRPMMYGIVQDNGDIKFEMFPYFKEEME